MGYFLLYESMLDTVLYARDKWLKKDGLIFPNKATMHLTGIEDFSYKKQKIHFWDEVYGINMSCIKPAAISEPLIDRCDQEPVMTSIAKIFDINLNTVKKEDLDFSNSYEVTVLNNNTMHAFVAWFDVSFDCVPNIVSFSTGPFSPQTHWKQTVFYLEKDLLVQKGINCC